MANSRPRVRWLTNVALNVEISNGDKVEKTFKSGHYTDIKKVLLFSDGYADIYIGEEEIVRGIKLNEAVELHGRSVLENAKERLPVKKAKAKKPTENKTTKRKWPKAW